MMAPPSSSSTNLKEPLASTTAQPQLTPRSSEACRRTGVDPRELVPLPPEVFKEPGQSEELQQLKFQHYENGRLETFKMVQEERERIIRDASRGTLKPSASEGSLGPGIKTALQAQSDAAASTAYLKEKRILEKIQKRQQEDIQQLLMFELKAAQLNEEKAEKIRQQQDQSERARREREAKGREYAEARRRWDEDRRKQEVLMEKDARRRQQVELQREARRAAEEALQARRLREKLAKKEEERVAKQEARRLRQQEIMAERQQAAAAKAEEDARREAHRLQRIEEQRQARQAAHAESREKAATRVSNTLAMQAQVVEDQRSFYAHRMELEEQRRQLFTEQRRLDLERRKRRAHERQEHIKGVQGQMERVSEENVRRILHKERTHEELMHRVYMERHEQMMRSQTQKDMKMYQRQMKLARNQRKDEYRREMTSEKIRMETQRAEDLKASRQAMLLERRTMRNQTVMTRQALMDKIDKMRQSNSFYLPKEMRAQIENPELLELMERCDELGAETGGKVTMHTMREVLEQMQSEGKLQEMLPGHRKQRNASSTSVSLIDRPSTAPEQLSSPM